MNLFEDMKNNPLYDVRNRQIKDRGEYIFKRIYGSAATIMQTNNKGFDALFKKFKIEIKWRNRERKTIKVDITKSQYEIADIVGLVTTDTGEDFRYMPMIDYKLICQDASGREISKCGKKKSKYKQIYYPKFIEYSTTDLESIVKRLSMIKIPKQIGTLEAFI